MPRANSLYFPGFRHLDRGSTPHFGPDRLAFGSDWPPCTLEATYAQVIAAARALTADLSATEQDAIFNGTARVAYRLP